MNPRRWLEWRQRFFPVVLPLILASTCIGTLAADLGLFEEQGDVGKTSKAGSVAYDQGAGTYLVTGGGENMWFATDAFHFVWKRISGDFVLQSAIDWPTSGGNAHRKGCLMIREGLEADAPYIDVAFHGDGLTSMQFREERGGTTHEIQAREPRPARVAIERQGDTFWMSVAVSSGELQPSGAFRRIALKDPLYVGLAVCSHDDQVLETARFRGVQLTPKTVSATAKPIRHATLETIAIGSKDRRAIYPTLDPIEAPNWSRDGRFFLFNSRGRIFRLPIGGGTPETVETGFAVRCNNDHGLSFDGAQLVISDQSRTGKSLIYLLPASGGEPRQVTPLGPSYWHGWSPDGTTLAYCAERNGEFDVYTIPVQGGEERRLTTAKGLDDGPEYTPDGRWIYFNSNRTGTMQIWRMHPDGGQQEQVTSDGYNDWFPHPSPDGRWIVFLSYEKDVEGHPADKPVRLRLMPLGGGPTQELARLFGGQGTINVPSWSPDSRNVAFVSYELVRQ